MKVLITGATGLIGRKLTEKLLNEDFDIHYLTTVKSKINIIEGQTLNFMRKNLI